MAETEKKRKKDKLSFLTRYEWMSGDVGCMCSCDVTVVVVFPYSKHVLFQIFFFVFFFSPDY